MVTLRSAAAFAFIGMLILTILLLAVFVRDVMSFIDGLIPALRLLASAIYLLASLSVTVFFFAFQRAQR